MKILHERGKEAISHKWSWRCLAAVSSWLETQQSQTERKSGLSDLYLAGVFQVKQDIRILYNDYDCHCESSPDCPCEPIVKHAIDLKAGDVLHAWS